MAGDLVLLTGSTGHVGFRVLRYLLEYGYQVRAAVRSEAKAETVRNNPVLKAMNKDSQLSFVQVPDFLAPGAFDEAVKGANYVIHVASPITSGVPDGADQLKYFIDPAVKGTLGMLESARKSGTVKRVVITASVLSIAPLSSLVASDGVTYSAESRLSDIEPPFMNNFHGYSASKVAAFNRALEWVEKEKPSFDVIHVHPSFVWGRDDLNTSTKDFEVSTNQVLLNSALGETDPSLSNVAVTFNTVDDCARVHVLALDPKVEGNQSFLVANSGTEGYKWEDVHDIVSKHFPEAVKKGIFKNNTAYGTEVLLLDVSKTEKTFGFKHQTFEDAVVSVVGHWLELYEKEHK